MVVIQKWKEVKKCVFLQKLPDTVCVRKGEKMRIVVHTICFGPKFFWAQNSANQEKTIKIVVSAEIAQNQKWYFLLKKVFFWHGWKNGFY